jgi:type IV pilus assembly protein PilC
VIFARQMATMIDAGIPVLQSLEILAEQTTHKNFRKILQDVATRVAAGSSINKAMSKYTQVFSEFFVHVVKAGEESGHLDEILERVATYLEKTDKLIRKVKSALVYPIVVMLMSVAITVFMMIKVIPTFTEIYDGFDVALPKPTQILIGMSNFMQAYWYLIIAVVVAIVIGLKMFSKTPHGGLIMDNIKLRVPVFGMLLRKVAVSKFTRTLGTLLKSGVPILRSMDIVAKTSGNHVIERAVQGSSKSIREGRKIVDPLRESKVFPPMVLRMIAVGETSGELEKMLSKIADFYDDQVDASVAALTSLIEPLVIGFMGIAIGGIVVGMFLPMFQLANVISG